MELIFNELGFHQLNSSAVKLKFQMINGTLQLNFSYRWKSIQVNSSQSHRFRFRAVVFQPLVEPDSKPMKGNRFLIFPSWIHSNRNWNRPTGPWLYLSLISRHSTYWIHLTQSVFSNLIWSNNRKDLKCSKSTPFHPKWFIIIIIIIIKFKLLFHWLLL